MLLFADSIVDVRIVELQIKVNEDFGNNFRGHYAPDGYKRGGTWTFTVPELKANQGDIVYIFMRVKLGDEEFDTIVKIALTITRELFRYHTLSTLSSCLFLMLLLVVVNLWRYISMYLP